MPPLVGNGGKGQFSNGEALNLFYAEPDPDRWMPLDRYPRRVARRLLRGPARPGGQTRVFLNLCAGLDLLGVPFRVNDYRFARANPGALACIVGKPFLLDKIEWHNPILFGSAVYSHAIDDPNLLERLPVRTILVPGEWMRRMCEPIWGDSVKAWPVGIDTEHWTPRKDALKDVDVLLYDKIHWQRGALNQSLLNPIREQLARDGRSAIEIRYGNYREDDFCVALQRCKSMIYLSEHETQGIAYQQALAAGVPIFAWDRQGPWQDPAFYPDRVVFEPVTSVPYWDKRCGMTFRAFDDFQGSWSAFWESVRLGAFSPRDYILENLTLEQCARRYLDFAASAQR